MMTPVLKLALNELELIMKPHRNVTKEIAEMLNTAFKQFLFERLMLGFAK